MLSVKAQCGTFKITMSQNFKLFWKNDKNMKITPPSHSHPITTAGHKLLSGISLFTFLQALLYLTFLFTFGITFVRHEKRKLFNIYSSQKKSFKIHIQQNVN